MKKIEAKLWPVEGKQCFKEIWPSDLDFNPYMTQIQTWPRYYQVKHSGIVLWRLKQNCGFQGAHKVLMKFNLVFDLARRIFELGQDVLKSNIQAEFYED